MPASQPATTPASVVPPMSLDDVNKLRKICDALAIERDTLKVELSKISQAKSTLETLCRELQKENKRIKEESRSVIDIEKQRRDELSSKFEHTISEIKGQIERENQNRKTRDEENEGRFRAFLEQYEIREEYFTSILKSKDLELQLSEARLAQQKQMTLQESTKAEELAKQVEACSQIEVELRKQLIAYTEKFQQVEDTLNKSNELFTNFRDEMDQVTKKMRKLEAENLKLRSKCEVLNKNIVEMAAERATRDKQMETLTTSKSKLESLCRALQTERNDLKAKLEGKVPPSGTPAQKSSTPTTTTAAPNGQTATSPPITSNQTSSIGSSVPKAEQTSSESSVSAESASKPQWNPGSESAAGEQSPTRESHLTGKEKIETKQQAEKSDGTVKPVKAF